MSVSFKSDDELRREAFEEHRELLDDFENEPELGEDWREEVYSAKEQLVKGGFAEDSECFLVGHGERKDGNCGIFGRRKVKKLRGCLRVHLHNLVTLDEERNKKYRNKIYVERVFYSCNRPECPSCGVSGWAVREAGNAEAILKVHSKKLGQEEHIILSPSSRLYHLSLDKLRAEARKALLVRGVSGGCMVYHHFRYRNPLVARRTGLLAGWYKSPHFHIVGFIRGGYGKCRHCKKALKAGYVGGEVCAGCNGFEAVTRRANVKDGWICKVKGERKTVGGTLWYELSHASLRKGVKKQVVVTWFGECSYRKSKIMKGDLPHKEHLCKICGEKLYDIVFLGDYRKLLTFMSGFKDSEGFMLDAKDENGEWLWRSAYSDKEVRHGV
jgi:hypothetical protein